MTVAYPRRTDAVLFERFDGTLESAQKIANLTGAVGYVKISPNRQFCDGDVVRLTNLELNSLSVNWGDYVVRGPVDETTAAPKLEVLAPEEFSARYSKDGN